VQDRWKLTRTLTLNLGFRYEVEVPPTERHNYQSYFDFQAMAPIVQQAGLNNPGALLPVTSQMRSPENTYYRQVGPRFGFAWQATGQTVLRGGYGILWLPGGIEITGASSNNPTSSISTALVSSLDNGVTPFARLSNPFPQGLIPPGNGQGANSLIGRGRSRISEKSASSNNNNRLRHEAVQPAIRFGHAGHRPVASCGILQVVHHLSLGIEPENPGGATEFLLPYQA
jgi:hypothetical protein